jgi:hypothetical protein
MELEVGKFYRTREGEKCEIVEAVYVDETEGFSESTVFIGRFDDAENAVVLAFYDEDGAFCAEEGDDHDGGNDLISEWSDQIRLTVASFKTDRAKPLTRNFANLAEANDYAEERGYELVDWKEVCLDG